jgi:hypothetical protein
MTKITAMKEHMKAREFAWKRKFTFKEKCVGYFCMFFFIKTIDIELATAGIYKSGMVV